MFEALEQKVETYISTKVLAFAQSKDPKDAADIETAVDALTKVAVRNIEAEVGKFLPTIFAKISAKSALAKTIGQDLGVLDAQGNAVLPTAAPAAAAQPATTLPGSGS